MCQPGRPGPQGEGQDTSSSGFVPFQSAKSAGGLLRLAWLDAGTGEQVFDALAGEGAVAAEGGDPEVHVSSRRVGEAAPLELLDESDDLGQALRRERLDVRSAETEPVGVLAVRVAVARGERPRADALLARTAVDLVVDVRDVDDEPHAPAEPACDEALQHLADPVRPRIADVDERVDGGTADVDAELAGAAWLYDAGLFREAVVQLESRSRPVAHRSASQPLRESASLRSTAATT